MSDDMCAGECGKLRPGVKSPRETVAQALVGDYRSEHLFTLKQSLEDTATIRN